MSHTVCVIQYDSYCMNHTRQVIFYYLDDRNRPEYTEVRLDRNCYLTAALAAMIEIEEVERQLKADEEFEKENQAIPYSYSIMLLLITYALL